MIRLLIVSIILCLASCEAAFAAPPTRTVITGGVWANTAGAPPDTPVPGNTYRNSGMTSSTMTSGWPYFVKVDSANSNELFYRLSYLTDQLDAWGTLPWSPVLAYNVGAMVIATDGSQYICIQAGTNKNPTTQTAYWRKQLPWSVANDPWTLAARDGSGNFAAGTITADLNGSADKLDGQHGAYYRNASNINAGNLPFAYNSVGLTRDMVTDIAPQWTSSGYSFGTVISTPYTVAKGGRIMPLTGVTPSTTTSKIRIHGYISWSIRDTISGSALAIMAFANDQLVGRQILPLPSSGVFCGDGGQSGCGGTVGQYDSYTNIALPIDITFISGTTSYSVIQLRAARLNYGAWYDQYSVITLGFDPDNANDGLGSLGYTGNLSISETLQ